MKRVLPYFLSGSAYLAGIGLTITSAWLITTASFEPPLMVLNVAIVGVRFFGISRSVARYFERLTSHRQVFEQLSALRVRIFEAITAEPLALVRDLSTGKLVKRVVDDVERVQEYALRITLPHAAAFIALIASMGLGGWILPISMLVTLPACALLLLLLPYWIKRRCEVIAREIESLENTYAAQVQSAGHGIDEALFYGYFDEFAQETRTLEEQLREKEKALLRVNRGFALATSTIIGITLTGLAWMAHHFATDLPAVKVAMLIFLPLVMFESITMFYPNLFGAGKLLLARAELASFRKPASLGIFAAANSEFHLLEVRDLRVTWPGNAHFMKPVSFSMQAGDCLVIRGRSGSGKSTLAMALLGLLDHEGEILINGAEMRQLQESGIVGAIQNAHIFNTSLRENLKIARPSASDEELLSVISMVELDTALAEMPDGLDTVLGQFGRSLSGGEAKRLNLARALLSPAPVLVLDEPTVHLDADLAKRIENRIFNLGRTLIVITHSGWEGAHSSYQLERETHDMRQFARE